MKKDYTSQTLFRGFFAVCCLLLISQTLSAQVSGTVFRDFNANGVKDTYDIGVGGISVKATDAAGTVYGPVTSGSDGKYNLNTVPSGLDVRLEFTIPATVGCYDEKIFSSASGGTSVQFVQGGATNVDFGVNNPVDYAKTNPDVATTCFINGDITLPKTTVQFGVQVGVSDMDVALKFNYSKAIAIPSGAGSRNLGATPVTPNNTYYSVAEKMGAVWGLAYQKDSKKLFMSAIMRRHAQFGPLGTGGIYVVNNADGSTFNVNDNRNFIDVKTIGINTGTDPHPLPATSTNATAFELAVCDGPSYDKVGKIGIGDIDLSDDGVYLYMTNLNDRKLYRIKINNPATTPVAADVLSYDTAPWLAAGTCQNGVARPWATKYYRDKVYVGVVCTGENGGTKADLKALVYELDAKTDTWKSSPTFTQALNYTKGKAASSATVSITSDQGITWNPWKNDFPDPGGTRTSFSIIYPSPILSDIEFDTDGSMILGLMDRFGHQAGSGTKIPKSDGTCISDPARGFGPYTSVAAGGDLLRIGLTSACVYESESNGTAAGKTSLGAGNSQGIGGGEYYSGDNIAGVEGNHEETFVGGLAILPGSNQLLGSTYDPMGFVSGGVNFFDNTTGKAPNRYEVYPPNNAPFPGKGNGVGDIELLLTNAPIEIGNRLWIDTDKDGIQDAGESPIPNVKVALYNSSGVKVSEVTTDALGEYYFDTLNIAGGKLSPNTNYEIRIVKTEIPSYLSLTKLNSGTNDAIDSDGVLDGSNYAISVKTGNYGENNHTYDMGFSCIQLNAGADQTFCQMTPATYNLPDAPANQTWVKLSGTSTINATTGVITGLTAGTHEFILKYTATTDCADTVKFIIRTTPNLTITTTPATCPANGGNANNDAKINLVTTTDGIKVDYTSGSTYTGTKSYSSLPTGMPAGNVITVPNPSVTKNYTVRLFNQGGTCFVDKTLEVKHIDCPIVCPPVTCLPIDSKKN
jgi:Tfp pilus assembly major pilin PilA